MIRFGSMLIISVYVLTSCGSANVNKLFGSEDDSYSGLLQRAQYAYDEGDFSAAEKLADRAYRRSYNNGSAAVLLGNIYLSKAGIDVFQLVGKLSTLSSSSSSSGSTTSSCKSQASTTQSAASVLSELSCLLLNLTDADKNELGATTSTKSPGLKDIGVETVYIPNEVTDELRSKVTVLRELDKGIRALCPFVNRAALLNDSIDERHKDPNICPDRSGTAFNSAKVHISFALLHLVEALVFQQGVLIDGVNSAESSRTGVQGISNKITAYKGNVATLAVASLEFAQVVGKVFDTSNSKSQIALALNDLIMVSQAFEAAGVPPSVTSVITQQLTTLKNMANSTNNSQSQVLTGQINQAYANSLAKKINESCPTKTSCSADQTKSLCDSFTTISKGVDASKLTTPTACKP